MFIAATYRGIGFFFSAKTRWTSSQVLQHCSVVDSAPKQRPQEPSELIANCC